MSNSLCEHDGLLIQDAMMLSDTFAPDNLSGIVLAGGRSERLGLSVPKALLGLGGKLMLARVADTLKPLCHELIAVVRPDQHDDVPDLAIALGMHVVVDLEGYSGPLAAMGAGLRSATTPLAFIVGADHPFLSRPLVIEMARRARIDASISKTGYGDVSLSAVVPRDSDRLNPLHAVYPVFEWRELIDDALAAGIASPSTMIGHIQHIGDPPVDVMTRDEVERIDPQMLSLLDIDTLEHLGIAKRIIEDRMHRVRPDLKRSGI